MGGGTESFNEPLYILDLESVFVICLVAATKCLREVT